MKVRLLLLLVGLGVFLPSFTQERCGTLAPTDGAFEQWMHNKIRAKRLLRSDALRQTTSIYQIPVVVHILHQGEPEGQGSNLSKARIVGQIDSLTADFRRLNADRVNTPSDFLLVASDIEIEFVLARQDPRGNPTDGIMRAQADAAFNPLRQSDLLAMRRLSFWPADRYLNIYVNELAGGFIGFATFPDTDLQGGFLDEDRLILDAVFIDSDYFGNNPQAPSFESRGRTLTHEVGHFLGLRHVWGDVFGCGATDYVADTPEADWHNSGLGSPCTFPNPEDETVCTAGEPEMFQNYMDYTDDVCMNLFTEGQKARMRTVIESSPRRQSLMSSPGLDVPSNFSRDLAITRIFSPSATVCSGQFTPSIEVTNWGQSILAGYEVEMRLDGGIVATQTNSKTLAPFERDTLFFPSQLLGAGLPVVSFQITSVAGGADENTDNDQASISLAYDTEQPLPFTADFESSVSLVGRTGSTYIWDVQSAPNVSAGNQALRFGAFENTTAFDSENILVTPPLDLRGYDHVDLAFSYAYGYDPQAFQDGLLVLISYDCGRNFERTSIFEAAGSSLATVTNFSSNVPFVPSTGDWRTERVLLPKEGATGVYTGQVQLAFVGLNGMGNNLYLDDIVIEDTERLESDASIVSLAAPLVTCSDSSLLQIGVKNVGSSDISSLQIAYTTNELVFEVFEEGLALLPDQTQNINLMIKNLPETQFEAEIKAVNGIAEEPSALNLTTTMIRIDQAQDGYPLTVDFESTDSWVTGGSDPIHWERSSLSGNGLLKVAGYEQGNFGDESWFISPELNTGGLDSAGLSFRVSYAKRSNFEDALTVWASYDCGETYEDRLFYATADSLAVTTTDARWVPEGDQDWKTFRVDIQNTIPAEEGLRLAFVFSNGKGNDLYLDDIDIRANEPPTYESKFRVYPNPSHGEALNLSFNLEKKQQVQIVLLGLDGKIYSEEMVPNALNQQVKIAPPGRPGIYLIRLLGDDFIGTQKLFITP